MALLPVERASPSTWAPTASFPTWVLQGPGTPGLESGLDLRVRTRGQPLAFSPLFPPRPISYRPRGGGTPEEPELGLSQWADGPRARPLPSLRRCPIEIYYNVVATRAGGARGRAGCGPGRPRLKEGRREGARRGRSLAHLHPPFAGGLVSQSIRLQPASPRAAEGPSLRTPAPPPAIVRAAAAAAGAGARAPEPRVRRGSAQAGLEARSCPRGDGPGGRGGATASLSPAPRRPRARGARALWPSHSGG